MRSFTVCEKNQRAVILSEAKDLSAQCWQLLAPTNQVGTNWLIAHFSSNCSAAPQSPQNHDGFSR
jgi:hypothetical protein